ncbi:energy transducer TonB [Sphingomonas abietis]|uniref:Energy transducer TonB n=2 Tax=Sphingomonas abietis TaxID=3012344 RepID=A0ABY7NSU3_9SPHN|nr:energy transducer TonB [Sphingomonas abietis]
MLGTVSGTGIGAPIDLSLHGNAASKAKFARPLGYPGDWITSEDYPADAIRLKVEGATGFRLDIDADGAVARCTVTATSGSDELDQTACELLVRRARFSPAMDASGHPIAATYSSSVRWQIPQPAPIPIAPVDIQVSFDVDPQGVVSNCTTTMTAQGSSAMTAGIAALCTMFAGTKVALPPEMDSLSGRRHVTTRTIVTIGDAKTASSPPRPN